MCTFIDPRSNAHGTPVSRKGSGRRRGSGRWGDGVGAGGEEEAAVTSRGVGGERREGEGAHGFGGSVHLVY